MICIDHITYYTYKRFSGKTISNMSVKQKFYLLISGPGPIDILQRKFYTTLILSILIGYSNLSTNLGA